MTNKAMMTRHWKRITEVSEVNKKQLQEMLFSKSLHQHLHVVMIKAVGIRRHLFALTNNFAWLSAKVTGHTFEVETDTFKLRNIMEAPLLKYKEEIEVRIHGRPPLLGTIKYEKLADTCTCCHCLKCSYNENNVCLCENHVMSFGVGGQPGETGSVTGCI